MAPDDLTPEQELRRLQAENRNYKETAAKLQTKEIMSEWLEGQLSGLILQKLGPQLFAYELSELSPAIRREIQEDAKQRDGWRHRAPRYLVIAINHGNPMMELIYTDELHSRP